MKITVVKVMVKTRITRVLPSLESYISLLNGIVIELRDVPCLVNGQIRLIGVGKMDRKK